MIGVRIARAGRGPAVRGSSLHGVALRGSGSPGSRAYRVLLYARRLALVPAVPVVVLSLVGGAGCSSNGDPGATSGVSGPTLPFERPSKAELADRAGLSFPSSVEDYRSTLVGPSELNVAFTMAASDLEGFVSGSGLPALTEGRRLIAHPSPVWEQNPAGTVSSTASVHDGLTRIVEVVTPDPPTGSVGVRLVVSSLT